MYTGNKTDTGLHDGVLGIILYPQGGLVSIEIKVWKGSFINTVKFSKPGALALALAFAQTPNPHPLPFSTPGSTVLNHKLTK